MPDQRDDTPDDNELDVGNSASGAAHSPVRELRPLPSSLTGHEPRDSDDHGDHEGDATPASVSTSMPTPTPTSPIDDVASRMAAAPKQRPRRARRGDVIGQRYVVDGQIGKGGMGRVLRVRHQVLGKYFALKLIRAPIAADKLVGEMFYREARLASSLHHDNICSIVDFGNDPDFGLFMVMELLEGVSLYAKLREDGPMAPKAGCAVMWDIAKAVKHMHDRSIVHGDIKSRNILLVRTAHKHRLVKLTDFGLARVDVARTSRRVEGTPEYMAPELIRGNAASPRSDIYALGILFYEILVGIQPFKGETEAVFRQHLEDPVPKPSEQLEGAIDERADEIIARATAKDPAERHQDMDEFLFELRTFMNMLGIATYQRPRNPMEPPRSPRKRNRSSSRRIQGAAEVFEYAPIPLAAVDSSGKVRVANAAFLEFLGVAGDVGGIELAHSHLPDVYPQMLKDLSHVVSSRSTVKRVIELWNEDGRLIQVAAILSASPSNATVTGGDVHIALHPLTGRAPEDEPERARGQEDAANTAGAANTANTAGAATEGRATPDAKGPSTAR